MVLLSFLKISVGPSYEIVVKVMMSVSHIGTLVQVPAALLLIQLPANVTWKAAEDDPGAWAPTTTWETWMEFRLLALAWLKPNSLGTFGE